MSHLYAAPTYKPLDDIEKGPYTRSPLSRQVEFPDALKSPDYPGLGLDAKSTYASAHSLSMPIYNTRWVEKGSNPKRKTHRRIDTATFIALATRPFLTPHRILSLFAIVCAASYIARILPLFFNPAAYADPIYNPDIFHRPPVAFEPMKMPPPPTRSRPVKFRTPKERLAVNQRAKGVNPKRPLTRPKPKMVNNKQALHPDESVSEHLIKKPEFFAREDSHDGKLDVVVVDGAERDLKEQVEVMERIEAGLDSSDDVVLKLEDWAEGEESESAADWLTEQVLDDSEDAFYTSSLAGLGQQIVAAPQPTPEHKRIPLPLRGSNRAPARKDDVAGYLVKNNNPKGLQDAQILQESLFREEDEKDLIYILGQMS